MNEDIKLTRSEAIDELREMKGAPWNDQRQEKALDIAINSLKIDELYDLQLENPLNDAEAKLERLREAIDPKTARYLNGSRKELWSYDEILAIIDGKEGNDK